MSIANTLRLYLDQQAAEYELMTHAPTVSSTQTAHAAHVPGERVAKPVVIEDADRYCVVVIPATRRIDFTALHHALGRQVGLATEKEVEALFGDCAPGAIPAPAQAYGLEVLVDDDLLRLEDVYFDAGDHEELVHMPGAIFRRLMSGAMHGRFSEPMGNYGEGRAAPS